MSTDAPGRRYPLSGFFAAAQADSADDAGVVISERPFLGHLNLRGDPADAAFTSAGRSPYSDSRCRRSRTRPWTRAGCTRCGSALTSG